MDISLLKHLTMAPGISGREESVRDIVEENLGGLTAEVSTDAMGSLIAKERVIPVDELFVDVGMHPGDVKSQVKVGDPVTFPGSWSENDSFLQAKAFDDRAGLFVMLEALKLIPEPGCDLYIVASAQEEVGLEGAGPVARRINPDLVLALEGTGARAAALSVPVRYIHAPVSLLNKSDLEAAIALVAKVLKEVRRFEPDSLDLCGYTSDCAIHEKGKNYHESTKN